VKRDRRKPGPSALEGVFLLTMGLLAYLGAIGFGVVWLRHHISVTANAAKTVQVRAAEAQRRLAEVSAEIATAASPEQLLRRNEQLRLGLVQPREEQVKRPREDVERLLAAKRLGRLFATGPEEEGTPFSWREEAGPE
jgi:hypothetical protein